VFARLDGFPPGHTKYFLRKALRARGRRRRAAAARTSARKRFI